MNRPCPFCRFPATRIIDETRLAAAIRDGFPVSPGHTLIIPRRHVASLFETTTAERDEMLLLLDRAKARLDAELKPAAYNIGINDGPAAGQTIAHLHIHLIPRFAGDSADPRGGVRWVLPDKAKYWT
jgi:diadenosine tetraphosphate (Ap4A) HIT family hydrolase